VIIGAFWVQVPVEVPVETLLAAVPGAAAWPYAVIGMAPAAIIKAHAAASWTAFTAVSSLCFLAV
jgi:hypothetical protein